MGAKRSGWQRGHPPPPPPVLGRSVPPISTEGNNPAHYIGTGPPGVLDLIFGRNLIKTHLCVEVEVNSVVTVAMVVVVVDGVVAVLVALGNFEVVGNVEVTFGMEVDVVVSSDVSFLVLSSLKLEFCTIHERNMYINRYIELSLIKNAYYAITVNYRSKKVRFFFLKSRVV